ncbi:hypothetical protein [Flavobacterium sp. BFFFF1]|uniref:hypothetical protein n=1 Tax=Flavobacterium sp. BFFFF1 TaxID=2015557 RepID=UPI0025C71420|nr:hypothetical protein [Flavobacterium sp. BFFFF1]
MKYLILIAILFVYSRKGVNKSSENFSAFNSRFHSDSIFQMQRIKFPIEGELKTKVKLEKWSASNWKLLKKAVGKPLFAQFKQDVTASDSLVIEKISYQEIGFESEIRFKLINGKWYLIFRRFTDIH